MAITFGAQSIGVQSGFWLNALFRLSAPGNDPLNGEWVDAIMVRLYPRWRLYGYENRRSTDWSRGEVRIYHPEWQNESAKYALP